MLNEKMDKYIEFSKKIKILCEPKRLQIIDLLSCRDLCACEILEYFHISQPTLSNIYYKLKEDSLKDVKNFIDEISTNTEDCICKTQE